MFLSYFLAIKNFPSDVTSRNYCVPKFWTFSGMEVVQNLTLPYFVSILLNSLLLSPTHYYIALKGEVMRPSWQPADPKYDTSVRYT